MARGDDEMAQSRGTQENAVNDGAALSVDGKTKLTRRLGWKRRVTCNHRIQIHSNCNKYRRNFRLTETRFRRKTNEHDHSERWNDHHALYSGAKINDGSLVPGNDARLGETRFETWAGSQVPHTKS